MLLLITSKISEEDLKKAAEELGGYIKYVVDIKKEITTAGGSRHVQGEELLLHNGSTQEDLWGGGLDLETGEVDFDSMINIRPNQNNPSREVLSPETRKKIEEIVRRLLK
ncbi:MAG: hypothetical protein A3I44_02845 [Candidatus Sungbacteria bacterium RIFCSPLOWO2_02_FULL_51_17]|uniref:Uncharacterized protein n=1 Tax=Candidatus Sungbacteria bacterium RIFCSPHIGHO2_02_FULL_51_29 TaxID=1802273 RepID=A0A1G2KRK0_9BACT|nr:MAG: hypothetical protein A2676_00500 [Candidatus Sungbacteria bacterium RIFCSPHIGHO2_01_FULL_51_22]OHA02065.1 MAG: hypothetical protein A3C16_04335 [Candidatus Sungbacteria bacterium RIFCSPHIGHO2_02_FULL_51_29]OHA10833.1 MAG: hypothetical protein A3I44_02845 [Candidatus Sungbacteria bacterium RIFCSPLOWO2_02_FULL_51_17]